MKEKFTFQDWLNNDLVYIDTEISKKLSSQYRLIELVNSKKMNEDEFNKICDYQRDCFDKAVDNYIKTKLDDYKIIVLNSPNFKQFKNVEIDRLNQFLKENQGDYRNILAGNYYNFNSQQCENIIKSFNGNKINFGLGQRGAKMIEIAASAKLIDKIKEPFKKTNEKPKYHIENYLLKNKIDFIKKIARNEFGELDDDWVIVNQNQNQLKQRVISFLKVIINRNYFKRNLTFKIEDADLRDLIVSETFGLNCREFKNGHYSNIEIENKFHKLIPVPKPLKKRR